MNNGNKKPWKLTTNKDINKLLTVALLCLALAVVWMMVITLPPDQKNEGLTIGIPDDAGGLVIKYLADRHLASLRVKPGVEAFPIKDCCSSTSQWALSSERVDLAIVCPDAAQRLLEKDSRYVLVGPCMINSDTIVMKAGARPRRIGITQNRWYQRDIVINMFGTGVEVVPMLPGALPYALTQGAVDGIVVDVIKGASLPGEHIAICVNGKNQVTYVLVARKEVLQSDSYKELMPEWRQAVRELRGSDEIEAALQVYFNSQDASREAREWITMQTKLIYPSK
ncbi:MAG: ABC transporter substrate-binding (seleno)protein SaoB [Syntrophomonas sp.]